MTSEASTTSVEAAARVGTAVQSVISGKPETVHLALTVLLAGGHLLIEDVPGVGKTMLAKSLARALGCSVRRIQFTPDLLPGDVVGVSVFNRETRDFEFKPGAVFANIVLGDEINRASPKTQSALLECMEEGQVTVDGTTYLLGRPFMVIATQNPAEMEGTYPLPEAQLDRFMFDIRIDYLSEDDEVAVVSSTTSKRPEPIEALFTGEDLLAFQEVVRRVPIAEETARYAVRLVAASRPHRPGTPDFVNEWVNWGAGLRAAQCLVIGGKARALLGGRSHVTPDDIRALAHAVLRHRVLTNFRAEAEGVTPDGIVDRLIQHVPLP